jgi:hypothetical protein
VPEIYNTSAPSAAMLTTWHGETLTMARNNLVLRALLAFVIAASVAYVVATLFFTTANLLRLGAVGAQISFSDAMRTFFFDVRGMAPSLVWTQYGSLIFIGFSIALPVAALLRWLASRSDATRRIAPYLYPLAGATAIAVILIASYPKYEVFMIAGARGALGSLAQCLAGAIGGYLFHLIATKSEALS